MFSTFTTSLSSLRSRALVVPFLLVLLGACQTVEQSPPISNDQGILFGPPRCEEGGIVRMVTRTVADGDLFSTDASGTISVQRVTVERERVLERETMNRRYGIEREIELRIIEDHVRTTLASSNALAEGRAPGPLAGRVLQGKREGAEARWTFQVDGPSPDEDQEEELAALAAYENRGWFTSERVQVGDEWAMETTYLRHLLKRDISDPTLVAKARLEEVRAGTARISVKVRGEGHRDLPQGGRSSTLLKLEGTMLVDLDTLLDRRLELDGILETAAESGAAGALSSMPMSVRVEKSWLQR